MDIKNLQYWKQVAKVVLNDNSAKVGYKVVTGIRSFRPATKKALQKIRYKLDEETSREFQEYGCFAVFTTLENAKKFIDRQNDSSLKILLVGYSLCTDLDKRFMWKKNPPHFVKSGRGYRAESSGITKLLVKDAPRGTVLAESIYVFGIID